MKNRGEEGSKGARAIARALVVGASVAVVAIVGCALALGLALRPVPSGSDSGGLFTIERGATAQSVAYSLEREGYIRSALAFRIMAKVLGRGSSLKAGSYRILPGINAKRILDEFVSGEQALTRVTLPEGFTLSQVAALLERLGRYEQGRLPRGGQVAQAPRRPRYPRRFGRGLSLP